MLSAFQKYINIIFFIKLFFAFILMTIIGTLSHEFGHCLVAQHLDYDVVLHHASMNWLPKSNQIVGKNDVFFIILGGPLQTIITGTIGLILLFIFRKSFYSKEKLIFKQWLMIFTTLFWLRQPANLFTGLVDYIKRGSFSIRGDEIKLAYYLKIPSETIITITGLIGLMILAIVIFKFIPQKQRLTFILAGFLGGITGFLFWIELFGRYIIP